MKILPRIGDQRTITDPSSDQPRIGPAREMDRVGFCGPCIPVKDVDYTDEMVAALLKREDKEDEGAPEEESNKLLDDYFSGFKVAKYQLTEEEKAQEKKEAAEWQEQIESNVDQELSSPNYSLIVNRWNLK